MSEDYVMKMIDEFVNNVTMTEGRCIVCDVIPSKSGMSRKIKYLYWNYNAKSYYNINLLLNSLGYKVDDKGYITVKGCGMDMIWNTLCNIYEELHIDKASSLASHYTVM